jgi:hypothetical protein
MNMIDVSALYPMPDTHCPAWCERDHVADWQDSVLRNVEYDIPMSDGTVRHLDPSTPEELARRFEPFHQAPLGLIDLEGGESWSLEAELGECDGVPHIYLNAEGDATAAQVRQYAALLLNAADRLDEIAATTS